MTRPLPRQTVFFTLIDDFVVEQRSDLERSKLHRVLAPDVWWVKIEQCPSIIHHGPGHQSRTRCEGPATVEHITEDDHWASTWMGEWEGTEAYEGSTRW